ncbi:HepT-like ribonuclease domain-containing protein [Nodosilinea sp. PGN35]
MRAENLDIRWRQIAGLRAMVIHKYAQVNLTQGLAYSGARFAAFEKLYW